MLRNNWFLTTMREEAAVDGDQSGAGGEDQQEQQQEQQAETQTSERPEWLLDKYLPEGREVNEAISEQAKAYNELQGRFGAFTGAPEEYSINISDEMKEAGIEFAKDDLMIEAAMEFAKDSNMDQAGFDKMVGMYATIKQAEKAADAEYIKMQMQGLGANAQSRIDNINEWGSKNLTPEQFQGLTEVVSSAEGVKAIEAIISKTRNAPVNVDESQSASGPSLQDLQAMQFAKDQHGNRRIATDPEYRKEYNKLRDEFYGTHEAKTVVR